MVFTTVTTPEERALIRFLHSEKTLSLREIGRKTGRSAATVMRVIRNSNVVIYKASCGKQGRPSKLSNRQQRLIFRALHKLRRREGNFTAKRLMKEACIPENEVSVRTVRRLLNSKGYWYLQARKKGLLTDNDMRKRVAFSKTVRQQYGSDLWTKNVCFYLDGVSFAHKTNPLDQARAPTGRIYRKKSEGLDQFCTSKGSKVGSGGKVVKFIVAISYNEGVVLCKDYEHMNAAFFSSFIDNNFEEIFQKANKCGSRLWLQDGDPSQNSAAARNAMERVNAELLKIPARSPDLNPIENLFKSVGEDLRTDAFDKQISHESYTDFKERVRATICRFPISKINNLIQSMDKRLQLIIERKGQRIKY